MLYSFQADVGSTGPGDGSPAGRFALCRGRVLPGAAVTVRPDHMRRLSIEGGDRLCDGVRSFPAKDRVLHGEARDTEGTSECNDGGMDSADGSAQATGLNLSRPGGRLTVHVDLASSRMNHQIQSVKRRSMINTSYESIGKRVRIARGHRGVSQNEVASLGGPSRPTLSRIERGEKVESLESQIRRIALVLGVKARWLLFGEGQMESTPIVQGRKELGIRLEAYRKALGLSQAELSKEIGVSIQSLRAWERGEASPQVEQLYVFAKVFKTTLEEMFAGTSIFQDLIETVSTIQRNADSGVAVPSAITSQASRVQPFSTLAGRGNIAAQQLAADTWSDLASDLTAEELVQFTRGAREVKDRIVKARNLPTGDLNS